MKKHKDFDLLPVPGTQYCPPLRETPKTRPPTPLEQGPPDSVRESAPDVAREAKP